MQPLNDDMDNLFRRAAENYPLNVSGADWSKVHKALQDIAVTPPEPVKEEKRRYFLFFLLFAFNIISVVTYRYFATADVPGKSITQVQNSGPGSESNRNVTVTPESKEEKTPGQLETVSPVRTGKSQGGNIINTQLNSPAQPHLQNLMFGTIKKTFKSALDGLPSSTNSRSTKDFTAILKNTTSSEAESLVFMQGKLNGSTANLSHNGKGIQVLPPIASLPTVSLPKVKRFYAGVFGGVDGTTVKFQKITNVGFDYGVLMGYTINKKLSIETGAFWDNKYYYTDGEYFSTKKISLPPNSEITRVDGNCRMIEIPVALKYNISHNKKGEWFATTGFTNYFMKKENYEYTYYYPLTGRSHDYYASYDSKAKSLVSNLQLSAGYTRSLGRVGDLRIEPYIKVPLRGVGTGSLPLTSGGIHLGITRKLF
ncbi:MAG: outer membrane beta-barrel protein [Candidatus Dadabacteria bacterium]